MGWVPFEDIGWRDFWQPFRPGTQLKRWAGQQDAGSQKVQKNDESSTTNSEGGETKILSEHQSLGTGEVKRV